MTSAYLSLVRTWESVYKSNLSSVGNGSAHALVQDIGADAVRMVRSSFSDVYSDVNDTHLPRKHEALAHCWLNVGPASRAVGQHLTIYLVHWVQVWTIINAIYLMVKWGWGSNPRTDFEIDISLNQYSTPATIISVFTESSLPFWKKNPNFFWKFRLVHDKWNYWEYKW